MTSLPTSGSRRYAHRHTKSLLKEVRNRIADQCYETGHEDLVDGLLQIVDALSARQDEMKSLRPTLLRVLKDDDWIVEAAACLSRHQRQWTIVNEIKAKALEGCAHDRDRPRRRVHRPLPRKHGTDRRSGPLARF